VGPANFVLKYGTPMILMFFWREKVGRYSLVFERINPDPAITDEQEQLLDLTQQWVKRLEYFIRQHPDQYFWFHRRWKTQP